MTTVKKKRGVAVRKALKPFAEVIRTWYLDTALDFMCSKKLNESEESFFEDVTDFYLEALEALQNFKEGDTICPFLQENVEKDLAHMDEMLYNIRHKEQTNV